jgi:hypothetical protein
MRVSASMLGGSISSFITPMQSGYRRGTTIPAAHQHPGGKGRSWLLIKAGKRDNLHPKHFFTT